MIKTLIHDIDKEIKIRDKDTNTQSLELETSGFECYAVQTNNTKDKIITTIHYRKIIKQWNK